ncbi:hypothetical protein [Jannaschia ovalis]|uniref:Tetratricopeptide repeat-containing protein n=1 Tax=Jannaschia ovalis TaxID=3038773 RepID=A0ABY8LGZ4_9RHOB|nr:hypothetical protein [Jannaschia sp. GRR-S6-38]WGH79683.1 hypothetical protein P8627_05310 [Jannaschia sp. GRR-S6-38]
MPAFLLVAGLIGVWLHDPNAICRETPSAACLSDRAVEVVDRDRAFALIGDLYALDRPEMRLRRKFGPAIDTEWRSKLIAQGSIAYDLRQGRTLDEAIAAVRNFEPSFLYIPGLEVAGLSVWLANHPAPPARHPRAESLLRDMAGRILDGRRASPQTDREKRIFDGDTQNAAHLLFLAGDLTEAHTVLEQSHEVPKLLPHRPWLRAVYAEHPEIIRAVLVDAFEAEIKAVGIPDITSMVLLVRRAVEAGFGDLAGDLVLRTREAGEANPGVFPVRTLLEIARALHAAGRPRSEVVDMLDKAAAKLAKLDDRVIGVSMHVGPIRGTDFAKDWRDELTGLRATSDDVEGTLALLDMTQTPFETWEAILSADLPPDELRSWMGRASNRLAAATLARLKANLAERLSRSLQMRSQSVWIEELVADAYNQPLPELTPEARWARAWASAQALLRLDPDNVPPWLFQDLAEAALDLDRSYELIRAAHLLHSAR